MGNFNRGDRGDRGGRPSGGKRFGGDRSFGGRGGDRSERPTMHRATCAECGKSCEVPFRPTGDKPVFCSDCFGRKEGGNSSSRFERRDSGRPSFGGDKQMFQATCDKCHKECEVPFRPTGDKPVFCSDCFGKGEKGGSTSAPAVIHDQYKKQFEMLNAKLDNILKMLPLQATAKEEKPVIKKEEKVITKTVKKVAEKKVAAPKKVVKKVVAKKKKK
ncbi:MAG: CxxC-x17-CxxC domain-containing protein [Patescibacteria group bacterium]|jgi:CxxC-x17-CxxC domain-containing protein